MDRATKKQLLKACKLDEPVPPADPRHFDFDHPNQLRGQPWRERAAEVIDLASEPTTQIVTGLPGSGKSTELEQLRQDLNGKDFRVVLADAGAWIRDDAPITHQDVLLALVLALYPEGNPDESKGWLRAYAKRASELLFSEVQVGIDAKVGPLTIKSELTTNSTLLQQAAHRFTELRDLRDKVFDLLGRAATEADKAGEPLVIILDGIEKRATGDLSGPEEREKYRNHWFGAFLTHARELRPPVHVVYTVPPFMIRRASEIAAQFGVELEFLPMIRVFGHDAEINPAGVRGLVDALHLRVDASLFEDPAIARWLALRSGGYFRDLLRFVTEMTYQVEDAPKFTRAHAEAAVQKIGQSYREGLVLEEQEVLRSLRPSRRFPEQERLLTRIDALLQGFKMFRYHNSTPWYDAHPLLWHDLGFDEASWAEVERLS